MAKQTPEERQQRLQAKAAARAEHQRQVLETRAARRARSAEAMVLGPDVYAKRIIASSLQVPFIHFWYSLFYIVFDYIFGGHIIVKTWQKALIKAGYISEGALGVAGLWALANHVLHSYLASNPVTNSVIDPLNAFTMAAFTLIPDLILASAILVTINRYKAWINKEGKADWLWALAYTVPTIIFACLTAYTLSTVSSLAGGGDASKVVYASGTELQIRVLSAYFYGLIEILFAFTHKGNGHTVLVPAQTPQPAPVPQTPQIDVQQIINDAVSAATKVVADVATEQKGMISDLSQRLENATNLQRVQHAGLLAQVQQKPATPATIDNDAVANIVMQRIEVRLQTLLQQYTTVAPATNPEMQALSGAQNAGLLNAPRAQQPDAPEKQDQATYPNNVRTFQQRKSSGQATPASGKTAQIFDLLDGNPDLEPVELARLVSCDRTVAWKAKKRWMTDHKIVNSTPDASEADGNSGSDDDQEEEEVMQSSAG
ncbi:MAG TPA: hypothetical protein VFV38_08745 [Ktedonobacteraceae bacterium]|nr:hypothetical protein [Ktedonobacteraceae bacterium]